MKWLISWQEHDGHSIDEDSRRRIWYMMYKAVTECTERGAVAWALRTQAARQSGDNLVAYTLALGPPWFSQPNVRYFSSWLTTVMGVTKLIHTWKELVWHGQDLQEWVSSPSCSLSQISFWTFLPAHIRRGSDAPWSLDREGGGWCEGICFPAFSSWMSKSNLSQSTPPPLKPSHPHGWCSLREQLSHPPDELAKCVVPCSSWSSHGLALRSR